MATLLEKKAVEVTRVGSFFDERYGRFEITETLLQSFVSNFDKRVLGVDIFVDVSHRPEEGAAGKITRLWHENGVLLAEVDWTTYGRAAITEKGYSYLSAEYTESYVDNETGFNCGPVLKGAGLTIRPVVRHLKPIELSEVDALEHDLAQCAPKVRAALVGQFLSAASGLESELDRIALAERFREIGRELPAPEPEPQGRPLTVAEINLVNATADRLEREKANRGARLLQEKRSAFKRSLTSHPSWLSLSDVERGTFAGAIALIQPDSSDDFIVALAEQQTRLIDSMAIAKQLAALGWQGPMPSVRLSEFWGDDAE